MYACALSLARTLLICSARFLCRFAFALRAYHAKRVNHAV